MCLDRMMQNIHNISIAEIPKDCYSVSVGISVVNLKRSKNFEPCILKVIPLFMSQNRRERTTILFLVTMCRVLQ